jgi:hypothetical protein
MSAPPQTFAELVAAMQARVGLRVKISMEERGRIRRTSQGVVQPGLDDRTRLVPEDDGRLVFRLSPAEWYALDPRVITNVEERPDRRLLRVEMGGTALVIETFRDQARADAERLAEERG